MSSPQSAAPGWYADPSGQPRQRYFDGTKWTEHYSPAPAVSSPPPPPSLHGQDGAVYVRQQKPHSLTKHLLFGFFICWINVIYISISKNHYWTA